MSDPFSRLTAILDSLVASEKQAAHDCDKPEIKTHVGKARTGGFAKDDDAQIRDHGSTQPTYEGSKEGGQFKPGMQPKEYGTFTGTDPEHEKPSRALEDIAGLDFRKYVNKHAAAQVPLGELLRDASYLGNKILYSILNESTSSDLSPDGSSQPAAWDKQAAASTMTDDPGAVYEALGLAAGTIVGMQKRAEADADLVGPYLYSLLQEKFAAAQALENEEDTSGESEPPEESVEPSSDEEEGVESDEENAALKKNVEDTERRPSESEGEADNDTEADNDVEQIAEAAEVASSITPDDDQILEDLGMALAELGITPEELAAEGGVKGAKLASAFDRFRRAGKFKIDPAPNHVKRAARDYIKGYVLDLIRPTAGV